MLQNTREPQHTPRDAPGRGEGKGEEGLGRVEAWAGTMQQAASKAYPRRMDFGSRGMWATGVVGCWVLREGSGQAQAHCSESDSGRGSGSGPPTATATDCGR